MGETRRSVTAKDIFVIAMILVIVSMPLWVKQALGVPSVFAVVEGQSMEPTLHTGDLVLLLPKKPEDIQVGDVIVYRRYGGYVIHRVVYVYQGDNGEYCYVTWGDNRVTNKFPDFGDPSVCPTVHFRDPYTGSEAASSGVPYSSVVGVAVSFNGYIVKIPYIGSITLIAKR